jgi:hypothetical protein
MSACATRRWTISFAASVLEIEREAALVPVLGLELHRT